MANLKDSPKFNIHDDYYTPKYAWENIKPCILSSKPFQSEGVIKVWEACMLNSTLSKSHEYLKEVLGDKVEVIHDKTLDCLSDDIPNYDLIITNIPFDKNIKIPILKKFVERNKPFIIIMNSMNTFSKYFHDIFKGNFEHLQIITPSNKINFDKLENGVLTKTKSCSFYCVYICYKCEIPKENLFIRV